jgi:phosphoglucosamine mutase
VGRLFGTDGVRGVAGSELTAELARTLAAAAVAELDPTGPVVVGRDPRPSGGWLTDAVVEGLIAAGADVVLLGVIPTPAVARALVTGVPGFDALPSFGVVISASHNPMPDNGIKLFGAGGLKLADEIEDAIEARVRDPLPAAVAPGRVVLDRSNSVDWYADALLATLPNPLDGLRVVVDCANGAASVVARAAYAGAGADVVVVHDEVSGEHINDRCGATHLEAVQLAVAAHGADVGIAHDGDADRCLAVTSTGAVVDGDGILAILALDLHERGRLPGATIAATVMSNLGLAKALRPHGISVATTAVGDRYVTERMRADGLALGGEQSGHVVLAEHATTGDGILTALHLLARVATTGRSLAELAAVVERLPQVLVNVRVIDRDAALAALAPLTEAAAAELGETGRVLVRASGTEPLVRVMVEAPGPGQAAEIAERLAAAIRLDRP